MWLQIKEAMLVLSMLTSSVALGACRSKDQAFSQGDSGSGVARDSATVTLAPSLDARVDGPSSGTAPTVGDAEADARLAAKPLSASTPLGQPGVARPVTFKEASEESRETAEEVQARLVRRITVVPGVSSLEVYQAPKSDAEGSVHVWFHAVGSKLSLWRFEGDEGSSAGAPLAPFGPNGPRLIFIDLAQCPNGVCAGGCGAGTFRAALQWHHGAWSAPSALEEVDSSDFADADQDGAREFATTLGRISLTGCGARWCCGAEVFSVRGLVGWDGQRWSGELPRFSKFYEGQLDEVATLLKTPNDVSTRKGRCARIENVVRAALLRRIVAPGPDAAGGLRRAGTGLDLADCLPEEDDMRESWAAILKTWKDLEEEVATAALPRLPMQSPPR